MGTTKGYRSTEGKTMKESTRIQIENMKNQTIGVEVEMNNINRIDCSRFFRNQKV